MCEDARGFDMETPERSKIGGAPISKFEDSPVFNFMNNLSPIQPVNSSHGTQLFNSLSLTSISSVFSSPHVIQHKESRFLVRHAYADSSRHEISSDNLDESNLCSRTSDAIRPAVDQENCKIICSLNEASVDPPEECSTQPGSLPQPIQYDCGSPSHNTTPCYGIKIKLKLDNGHTPVEVAYVDDDDDDVERRKLFATEIELQEEHQAAQSTKEAGCSWDNLICEDADDMLIFDSPIDSENCKGQDAIHEDNDVNSLICSSSKSVDDLEISEKQQLDIPSGLCLQNATQYPPEGNNKELIKQHGRTDHTPQIFSGTFQNQVVMSDQNQETENGTGGCISTDCKVESQQQRGIRRRCLTFELGGGYTKDSNLRPSTSLPYNRKLTSDDKKSFSLKARRGSSPCILPSIGLHLNTLATTPNDIVVAKETVPPGRRFISMPSSSSPFPPITTGQYSLNMSSEVNKEQCPTGNEVRDPEVTHSINSEPPESGVVENLSQSSPKKKRQKSEAGKESETCKRCNCKKSKCLKLYCECFAAGIYCIEPCSCQGCLNKPIHEETVLATRKQIESRNPLAFAPKVIRASEPVQDKWEETNKTPASARHKRGCNCKKSGCLKKYCECYQGGVGCSPSCRCEGCKNPFGRKDASEEIEHDEELMDSCENQHDKLSEEQQDDLAQKIEDHSAKSILPITPSFEICRPFDKPPFLSTGKPPRASRLSIGYPIPHTLRKCEYPLQHKIMNHFKAPEEDDTPEILRDDASPNNGVMTVSPNGKRVSPPCSARISPNCKGARKLILKSIPSFPSLNNDVATEHQ